MVQRSLAFFTNRIICRSAAIQAEFIQMGVAPDKLVVAAGGTDVGTYKKGVRLKNLIRKTQNISPSRIVIGTACRLVPVKGLQILIESAKLLSNQRDDLLFLIIGEGPQHKELLELIRHLELEEIVKMVGHRDDLADLLNVLDLFVLSSYSEGMSNSILEAMACELPVVVSDIPPNKEIFDAASKLGCEIGAMFNSGDHIQLSSQIKQLLQREDFCNLGIQGRRVVRELYSLDARIDKELLVYQDLDG